MNLLKQTTESGFLKMTDNAISVLNLHHQDLKEKFPNNPMCFMEYYEKVDSKNVIEVRFDTEKVTLTCVFNEQKKCISSYLFFDNHIDVLNYIEYIKNNFTYDYIASRWLISHNIMSVKKIDKITSFMFHK